MNRDMTKGSPWGLIIRFMIPLMIGNVFQQFYNMVDTIIVGRYVGVKALAAVGATGTIMFLILGFMSGLTGGFTVITAQKFGAGDECGVKKSVTNGALLAVIITVIMMVLSMSSMRHLLKLMHTPDDIFDMSYTYIMILFGGMFATVLYNMASGLLRAVGNSIVPLVTLVCSAILNIVLDIILIAYAGMGVAGAALATVVSQFVSGAACLVYVSRKVKILMPSREHWVFDESFYKPQLLVGIPMALQFSITAIGSIILQGSLNLLGSVVIAANTAANKVDMLFMQCFLAIGQTMATYTAQNTGVNDVDRIRKGTRAATVITCFFAIAMAVIVINLVRPVVSFFSADITEEMLGYAEIYMKTVASFYIPLGLIFVFRNVQQGAGYSFMAMAAGIMELIGRSIIAMIGAHYLSYNIIVYASPAAWILADIFLISTYFVVIKRLNAIGNKNAVANTEAAES
ncbi:MAG: MATE family efflux transporter [Lachnospiraceae bacterium]|nr:MATE family efflux transporter [Lachnospiraceae bacterium]